MYYLKALGNFFSRSQEDPLQHIKRIEELKEQLVKEGYQPSEVNHFIKVAAGTVKLSEMKAREIESVIKSLNEQLEIAKKCKMFQLG